VFRKTGKKIFGPMQKLTKAEIAERRKKSLDKYRRREKKAAEKASGREKKTESCRERKIDLLNGVEVRVENDDEVYKEDTYTVYHGEIMVLAGGTLNDMLKKMSEKDTETGDYKYNDDESYDIVCEIAEGGFKRAENNGFTKEQILWRLFAIIATAVEMMDTYWGFRQEKGEDYFTTNEYSTVKGDPPCMYGITLKGLVFDDVNQTRVEAIEKGLQRYIVENS